jgi:hypothetical protein
MSTLDPAIEKADLGIAGLNRMAFLAAAALALTGATERAAAELAEARRLGSATIVMPRSHACGPPNLGVCFGSRDGPHP